VNNKKNFLEVKIFWLPIVKEIFFEGKAESISSQNKLGRFDILPNHANFISLIFDSLSLVTADKKRIVYQFKNGVLEVSDNKVNVFLGL